MYTKIIKSSKNVGLGLFSPLFFQRNFNSPALRVNFSRRLSPGAQAILPISMARYDGDIGKRQQYDKEIRVILEHTSSALKSGEMATLDVVSAAGLQEITWGKDKSLEIEEYFFKTHKDLLERQTETYTFNQLTEKLGKENFERCLESVTKCSQPGSEWYNLMEKTHLSTRIGGKLDSSLTYQRTEYAAIVAMSGIYTDIIYMGNLSLAWSYLYKQYEDQFPPIFTKAVVEKVFKKSQISSSEARKEVDEALRKVEHILTNQDFPKKEKFRLMDTGTSFFYAYSPRSNKQAEVSLNDDIEKSTEAGLIVFK